ARQAARVLVGAIVNASAVAERLLELGRDVTLLCAGTGGEAAMEDVIGAGAILQPLIDSGRAAPGDDAARMALRLFTSSKHALREVLSTSTGGRNLLAVGLEA